VDRNSPYADARFSRKTPKKGFYGYKCHLLQDSDSNFIVPVKTSLGQRPDGTAFPALAQPQAKETTGDKAYDGITNHGHLTALVAASGLPLTKGVEGPGSGAFPRVRAVDVAALPPTGTTSSLLARATQDREKIRGMPAVSRPQAGPLLWFGQSGHPNLAKVAIPTLMVALAVNLKRWVTVIKLRSPAFSGAYTP
jgi:hypothetical protein